MTPPEIAGVLAFQVWDAVGWAGQALFTARVLVQWLASERAGRSVVPTSFWWISLIASFFLATYVLYRRDPVFLVGVTVNGAIYVRNLLLLHRPERPQEAPRLRSPWPALLVGLGALVAIGLILWSTGTRIVSFEVAAPWLVLGFAGQAVWSSRFVVQWYASERAGRSVLPAAFFYVSLFGALLLLAYAIHRKDWVMTAAYALNPIPYVRNLILLRRAAASG